VRIAGLPAHGWRGGMNLFSGGSTGARTGRAGGMVAITGSLIGDVDGGRRRALLPESDGWRLAAVRAAAVLVQCLRMNMTTSTMITMRTMVPTPINMRSASRSCGV
jgi:hypothetical protein